MTFAKPFLKWVGGKRYTAAEIVSYFPKKIATYIEPMVGSGAVFFELVKSRKINRAILSDTNAELIQTYCAIQGQLDDVVRNLKALRTRNRNMRRETGTSKSLYYKIRKLHQSQLSVDQIAARMIYLNKTCFNGLYRVNKAGKFNSPYGAQGNPRICDTENLMKVSALLDKWVALYVSDYYHLLTEEIAPSPGDVIYFDPPYWKKDKTSFVSYTKERFTNDDHEKLASFCRKLIKNDVFVAISNLDVPEIRKLYSGFSFVEIIARRAVSGDAKGRGKENDLLILPN